MYYAVGNMMHRLERGLLDGMLKTNLKEKINKQNDFAA